MKYTDPTGHCITNEDGSHAESDAVCWQFVDAIGVSWGQNTAWWEKTFSGYDKESWVQMFGEGEAFDQTWMQGVLTMYLHSSSYQASIYGPDFEPGAAPEHPMEAFNAVIGDTVCSTWDCLAIGLDVASITLSAGADAAIGCAVASAGTAAGVCVPVAGVAKGLDSMVTIAGWGHTADLWRRGQASQLDLDVVSLTSTFSTVPGMGEAAGTVQLLYDIADPFLSIAIPNRQVK